MRIVDAMGVGLKVIPTAMLEMANLPGKKMEVIRAKVPKCRFSKRLLLKTFAT
jgi:hypothetical protein